MPAYIVVRVEDAPDPQHEDLVRYREANSMLVARHGGRFVVRGGPIELLDGDFGQRIVLIEFPDTAAARAWYDDPEYVAVRPLRQGISTTHIALVEGV